MFTAEDNNFDEFDYSDVKKCAKKIGGDPEKLHPLVIRTIIQIERDSKYIQNCAKDIEVKPETIKKGFLSIMKGIQYLYEKYDAKLNINSITTIEKILHSGKEYPYTIDNKNDISISYNWFKDAETILSRKTLSFKEQRDIKPDNYLIMSGLELAHFCLSQMKDNYNLKQLSKYDVLNDANKDMKLFGEPGSEINEKIKNKVVIDYKSKSLALHTSLN